MRNSLDAVADRDFALDYLYAAAVLFVHLSRIGEELVLWTTSEFGFARLPEDAATGSSIMPQKLNPDVAELARGKAGTAIGRLTGLLATVKSLPLAYDRDLQEDKPPVFAARDGRRRRARRARACSSAGSSSTADASPPPRPTRCCSPPTRRRRSSPRACRSATRTSRWPAQVRAGTFEAPAGAATGSATSRPPSRRRRSAGREPLTLPVSLAGRDLLRISDLVPAEAEAILDLAVELRLTRSSRCCRARRSVSTSRSTRRARASRSRPAMTQLGGAADPLTPEELQLSRGESLPDTARALSRYLDVLAVRTHAHAELEEWAEWATIPVINALTADEHPCQALADALTIRDRLGALEGVRVGWVGDGSNVLRLARTRSATLLGYEVVAACPPGYEPAAERASSSATRARPWRGADVVVTDTWISMGQEAEAQQRLHDLEPYRLDDALLAAASPTRSSCTACRRTRARRSRADVLYGDRSAIWDEAENRLHVQKALLALLLA